MVSRSGNGGGASAKSPEALLAVRDLCVSFRDDFGWLQMLAILLTALAFNALGESMRVALDPTMKGR